MVLVTNVTLEAPRVSFGQGPHLGNGKTRCPPPRAPGPRESDGLPVAQMPREPIGSSELVSRSGSSMRKSFALCEAFGLTPFPSPWIPPFQDAARSAREGLSAGKLPPTQPSVAERPSAPCTALRAAQCKCRYGRLRGEDLKEAGGLRPPASFKTSPLPRLDSLLGTLTRAGGGPPLRYGLLREGQGWGWRTTTAVRHAPVARP